MHSELSNVGDDLLSHPVFSNPRTITARRDALLNLRLDTLERVAAPQLVAGLAVLAGLFTAIWMRRKSEEGSLDAFAWPMAASLLCAPVVYPWYLLWLLPFIRSTSTVPIMIWTLSIIPTYYVWHLRTVGRPWLVPDWIMMLEYGSVAVAAAFIGRITRVGEWDLFACQRRGDVETNLR